MQNNASIPGIERYIVSTSVSLTPRSRVPAAMLPLKGDFPQRQSRLCPGARRSFFCRMRCKTQATVKEEADTTTGGQRRRKSHSFDRRYSIIHCTGYLKSWAPTKLSLPEEGADTGDSEGYQRSSSWAAGSLGLLCMLTEICKFSYVFTF